jgi:hypothetical protein
MGEKVVAFFFNGEVLVRELQMNDESLTNIDQSELSMRCLMTDKVTTFGGGESPGRERYPAGCGQSAGRAELRECRALRFLSATAGPQATAEQEDQAGLGGRKAPLIGRPAPPRCRGGRSEAMSHLGSDTNQKESHQNRASTTVEGPTPTLVLLDSTPGSPFPTQPPATCR